ncbi:hypothetical protein QBC40DRAFT_349581 [Triangularia verruculosa]|uniref:Uncharacterized protein n=1 Tax=Triangularia verruculosa TaxID=2587418 RepID=A0AAN6XER3_9PEZI|nr:hypothetical protein QBC40DRAFT_349581 [Triangularia verruculosa]
MKSEMHSAHMERYFTNEREAGAQKRCMLMTIINTSNCLSNFKGHNRNWVVSALEPWNSIHNFAKMKLRGPGPRVFIRTSKIKSTPPLGVPTWDFSNINRPQGRTAEGIWRFHSTEDDLKHDAGALKKGEIYGRDEFYKRAKAWYKAELDRLIYLRALEEKKVSAHHPNADGDKQPTADEGADTPAAASESKGPTRIQPSRAAKRKVPLTTTAPVTKKQARTRKKAVATNFLHTGLDYTLEAFDWEISNVLLDASQSPNVPVHQHKPDDPESEVGRDIAFLLLRLGGQVARIISEIHTDGYIKRRKAGNLRCAVDTALKARRKKYRLPKESSFQPAAKVLPGEDHVYESEGKKQPTTLYSLGIDAQEGRSASAGTPAPEAEMMISPTLGRWPVRGVEADREVESPEFLRDTGCQPPDPKEIVAFERRERELAGDLKRPLVEKLERDCTVTVSGLKFAVDLCQSEKGSEDGARFVML